MTVTITDDAGTITSLIEVEPGIYTDQQLKGTSGAYHLSVVAEGKKYTANSTMPFVVPFDSAYLEKQNLFNK